MLIRYFLVDTVDSVEIQINNLMMKPFKFSVIIRGLWGMVW